MHLNYAYGRRKEFQVGEFLERRRYRVSRSRLSHGAVDLLAVRNDRKIVIQVKATRGDWVHGSMVTFREETRLLLSAARRRASPQLALVSRNYVWFFRLRDGGLVREGRLKPLTYEYLGPGFQ